MTMHAWTTTAGWCLGLAMLGALTTLVVHGRDEAGWRALDRARGVMLLAACASLASVIAAITTGRYEVRNPEYAAALATVRGHPELRARIPASGRLDRFAYEDLLAAAAALDEAARDAATRSGHVALAVEAARTDR